jgi:DNA polymerase III delta subunit
MAKTDPLTRAQELAALPVCAPSVLVVAPDEIRRERVIDLVLKPFVDPRDPLAVRRLRGADLTVRAIDELRTDLFSVSLFAPQRYFVVLDFDRANAAVQKEIGALIEKIPAGSHLCITAADLKPTHPVYKFFVREERCVELPALEGIELKKWIAKELKKAGFTEVGHGVAEAITAVAEGSPDIAFTVIERVSLYLDGGRVEAPDVRGLFSAAPDPNEFALIDAVAQGNVALSEVLLTELCAEGKSPFVILALLTRTFSNYLVIKRLLEAGRSPADVRQLMGMTQWVFDKQVQGIRRYKTAHLARILGSLVRADAQLKNRSLGPEEVVSALCHDLRPGA